MILAAIRLSERSFAKQYSTMGVELKAGDFCVVEDKQTREAVGQVCALESHNNACKARAPQLPRVLRKAAEEEIRHWRELAQRETQAMALCKEKARELKLEMKIAQVRFDDRQRRVIFHFTADQRVDFRQLVRDLATQLQARIELWQIGVRDETREVDGFGVCGRQLCCAGWIKEFSPVSIRQAKDQDLTLSPSKLSGTCGRLRCCLTYEHSSYKQAAKEMPPPGYLCRCAGLGECVVLERNLLKREIVVRDSQDHAARVGVDEILEVLGKAPPGALRAEAPARPAPRSLAAASAQRETPRRPAPETLDARHLEDAPQAKRAAADISAPPSATPADPGQGKKTRRAGRRRRKAKETEGAPQPSRQESKPFPQAPREKSPAPAGPQPPASAAEPGQPAAGASRRRKRSRRRHHSGGGAPQQTPGA